MFHQTYKIINLVPLMQKGRENKQSEQEIIEFLINSGYDEYIIRKALTLTESRDVDDIVDVIVSIENNKDSCKVTNDNREAPKVNREEAIKVLEDNKKAINAERRYREELIRRYQEDKKNKLEEIIDAVIEEKIVEFKSDCMFNVRFPDSKLIKLFFSKDDTIEDLFNKIAEVYGSANFVLYKMRDRDPIKKSSEKLENNKKLFPKAALYIE